MGPYIVFVASVMAIWFLSTRGIEDAFLKVWLPFFLLAPSQFFVNIPGLPDPTFLQAAIFPIMYVLVKDLITSRRFRFGTMEKLLLAYLGIRIFNDLLMRGYSDAQNYGFYCLTALVGPYLIGAYVINSRKMDIATIKMFVLIFLILFPMSLYEAKFYVYPGFKLLHNFFPGIGGGLSIRYGIARTAGPFEHPILACIMIIATYRLHRWLVWEGEWSARQAGLLGFIQEKAKAFPFTFATQITIILIVMAAMTISRGPWLGGFAGALIAMCGTARNRYRMLVIVGFTMVIGGLAGNVALDVYTSPRAGEVLSEQAQSIMYRKELFNQYGQFLLEKLWTGWGYGQNPKVMGMESVDNAFFLMALQHGILAPILFLTVIAYAIGSQLKVALKAGETHVPIGFTFAGIYIMCMISFFTVYMGAQTQPLIFLMLGWGESIKNRMLDDMPNAEAGVSQTLVKTEFQRVML